MDANKTTIQRIMLPQPIAEETSVDPVAKIDNILIPPKSITSKICAF